jgi:hypothetical protein
VHIAPSEIISAKSLRFTLPENIETTVDIDQEDDE